jgi:hypothetical protein
MNILKEYYGKKSSKNNNLPLLKKLKW